jgi:hypothetical protein
VYCFKEEFVILGLFWFGGAQFNDLLNEARKKYGKEVNDVVNVSVDTKTNVILGVVAVRYYTLRGIAITFEDAPQTPAAAPESP